MSNQIMSASHKWAMRKPAVHVYNQSTAPNRNAALGAGCFYLYFIGDGGEAPKVQVICPRTPSSEASKPDLNHCASKSRIFLGTPPVSL